MVHVGFIWLFASPLCYVMSPDLGGKVLTGILATLGALLMLVGVFF